MQEYIIGALAFIFVLGAAMTIHEFGHFAVGRLLKIRVEIFSFIGIGPRVFGWKRGHTDYRLSLIPLGAYVKFGGDESNAAIEGAGADDVPLHERFDLRPRWQKFLVIVAGPAANILTALAIVFVGALLFGVPVSPPPIVGEVKPDGAAARAGLQPGDRIVEFNGASDPSWERIFNDAAISPDMSLPVVVERAGQRVPLTLTPAADTRRGEKLGVLNLSPDFGDNAIRIQSVTENSPAAAAGLQKGDHLVEINGEPVVEAAGVADMIQRAKAAPFGITFERDGARQNVTVDLRNAKDGLLGIRPGKNVPHEAIGVFGAVRYAFDRNVEAIRVTGKALGQIFAGKRSARETLSGPIGIAKAASQSANELGWAGVFAMLMILSLNLGIMNLLPIPILDGGAITLLGIEFLLGIVGVSLSMAMRERIQQVGFVALLLLMGFVITNDLTKLF